MLHVALDYVHICLLYLANNLYIDFQLTNSIVKLFKILSEVLASRNDGISIRYFHILLRNLQEHFIKLHNENIITINTLSI